MLVIFSLVTTPQPGRVKQPALKVCSLLTVDIWFVVTALAVGDLEVADD